MDALEEPDEGITRPPWGELGRAATLGFISATAKLFLYVLNTTELRNIEELHRAVHGRLPGVGLITVSNHTRCAAAAQLPSRFIGTQGTPCSSTSRRDSLQT